MFKSCITNRDVNTGPKQIDRLHALMHVLSTQGYLGPDSLDVRKCLHFPAFSLHFNWTWLAQREALPSMEIVCGVVRVLCSTNIDAFWVATSVLRCIEKTVLVRI